MGEVIEGENPGQVLFECPQKPNYVSKLKHQMGRGKGGYNLIMSSGPTGTG